MIHAFYIFLHLFTCISHAHLAVDFGCLILVQAAKCTCGISSSGTVPEMQDEPDKRAAEENSIKGILVG